MIVFPFAKINLGLNIVSRRPDGYHDIETVFYPVGLHDALEFVVAENSGTSDTLSVSGIETGSAPSDNLVIKALKIIREEHSFPYLNIHLHKAIPAGAGLGGGSSDAACIMKAVNRFFLLGMTIAGMQELSLRAGSDCPFFINGTPSAATGRGERLSSMKPVLQGLYLVLLNPGVHVSTREAYESCNPQRPQKPVWEALQSPVEDWKSLIFNDFESFAFDRFPVIKTIKEELYDSGALFSLMSGSGSSVFGIFPEKPQLAANLRRYIIFEGKI